LSDQLISQKDKEEYFRKLFALSDALEDDPEAEVPVPYSLPPATKGRNLVNQMKLGQKIGLLLFLHRQGMISTGGLENLMYLQEKAPLSAIDLGLRFAYRLESDQKLLSDFWRAVEILNLRPRNRRYRASTVRRIGVGYRDKGTLPDESTRAQEKANEQSFLFLQDLPEKFQEKIRKEHTACLTEDDEWLDLHALLQLAEEELREIRLLLRPM